MIPDEVLTRRLEEELFIPDDVKDVFKVLTGFYKADGTEIVFYKARPEGSMDWILQDACQFVKDADNAGVILKQSVLHDLAKTYGLKLTEALGLFDDQRGDLEDRKYRFTQCLVGFDSVLRMWGSQAPARINPEME